MVFSSIPFLLYFLPVALFVYFLSFRFRNAALFLLSLLFYAWGELEFVLLLLFSIAGNYLSGLWIGRHSQSRPRTIALTAGVVFNLSLLIFFKYAQLLSGLFNSLCATLDFNPWEVAAIHLPLGISFFTFQAISYLVDIYRGHAPVERRPLTVGLYIAMFPQLIAGPIVRFKDIVGQLHGRVHSLEKCAAGVRWLVVGLGMKIAIADTLSGPADVVFGLPVEELDLSLAWLGIVSFTLQIYFDFAGYSSMAIGLGLMFGFRLPRNFDYPYVARSISEFWLRWHMTLSQWFRDYLYIPLGGNRRGTKRIFFNLILVFLLCGLWHGGAWNFVVWGLFHGVFLIVERLIPALKNGEGWKPLRHGYTLAVVICGWVLFRCSSLGQALSFGMALVGGGAGDGRVHHVGPLLGADVLMALVFGALAAFGLPKRVWSELREACRGFQLTIGPLRALPDWLESAGLCLLFFAAILMLAVRSSDPFIYFRF